jgi:hypothetical protein
VNSPEPRRLRVRRPKPERLIELGVGFSSDDLRPLRLTTDAAGEPYTLVRAGPVDFDAVLAAVQAGARPSAVVVGLTERPSFLRRARDVLNALGIPWLADPLVFRTALPGYRTADYLQDLDYAPGRDEDPFTVEDFDDPSTTRLVGRSAVGRQFDAGATGAALCGAFLMSRPDDGWMEVNRQLAGLGIGMRDTLGALPVIVPVICRLSGFLSEEGQLRLVETLSKRRPEAFMLLLDGLDEGSDPKRIAAALRLARMLQAGGVPVFPARVGSLRHLFRAFGIRGLELALGRLARFQVRDYRKRTGPGHTPPRFEFASLACALPHELAQRVLATGVLPENDCPCRGCRNQSADYRTVVHNAFVVTGEDAALAGAPIEQRTEHLRTRLSDARYHWHDVVTVGRIELGPPRHLDRWSDAIDIAASWGLLASADELAARYGLSRES